MIRKSIASYVILLIHFESSAKQARYIVNTLERAIKEFWD